MFKRILRGVAKSPPLDIDPDFDRAKKMEQEQQHCRNCGHMRREHDGPSTPKLGACRHTVMVGSDRFVRCQCLGFVEGPP